VRLFGGCEPGQVQRGERQKDPGLGREYGWATGDRTMNLARLIIGERR
jgi:hypothetical protein